MTTEKEIEDVISTLLAPTYGVGAFGESEKYPPSDTDVKAAKLLAEYLDHLRQPMVDNTTKNLVEGLDFWRHCMSYNDSYFGEPPGFLKSTIRQLAKHIDKEK